MIDLSNGLTVADLLTLFGNAVVVAIVVELAKRTLALSPETTDRFGPIIAVVTGIALAVAASLILSRDPIQGALTGFLAGALACGLYDVVADRIATIWQRIVRPTPTPPPA